MFIEEVVGKILVVRCPSLLGPDAAQEFTDKYKAWLLKPLEHFVIDFSGTIELSPHFYKPMILMKTSLRKDQKSIYSVGLKKDQMRQIVKDGVKDAFNPIESVDSIPVKSDQKPGGVGLDVKFLNPFLAAIKKTFEVQCNVKVTIGKVRLKSREGSDIAIAGILTLISNGFSGSIAICFPKHVFLKIYENMFDEKHEGITPEIEDAAGELLNIIYGSAKVELNQEGYNFQKALPTVLSGEKMSVRQTGPRPPMVIPVSTNAGDFHVEIEFQSK